MKFVVLALFLVCAGALTYVKMSGRQNTKDIEDLVLTAASKQLKQRVAIIPEFRRELADWTFLCGTIIDASGASLQMDRLVGGANGEYVYESVNFCALQNQNRPDQLTEFDFGSTDMPALDWIDTYDIPPEILSEPIN